MKIGMTVAVLLAMGGLAQAQPAQMTFFVTSAGPGKGASHKWKYPRAWPGTGRRAVFALGQAAVNHGRAKRRGGRHAAVRNKLDLCCVAT